MTYDSKLFRHTNEEMNYSTSLLTTYLREKVENKRRDNEETKKKSKYYGRVVFVPDSIRI